MPKVNRKPVKGIWLGIDPGAKGGLACVSTYDPPTAVSLASLTLPLIWDWFRCLADRPHGHVFAAIEKVGGFMGTDSTEGGHRNRASAHTMFQFGASFGALRAFLVAAAIPYVEITPQVWQKATGLPPRDTKGGESRYQWKKRLRVEAQRLFPDVKVTETTADALLLAGFCRQVRGG